MTSTGKPLWLEGMFLRPQHLQQYDRWIESNLDQRVASLAAFPWGIRKLSFDLDALKVGQIRLLEIDVVFPDGTTYAAPEKQPLPAAIQVGPPAQGKRVFLTLPIRAPGGVEVAETDGGTQRFRNSSVQAIDTTRATRAAADISVGLLNARIMLDDQPLDEMTVLPIAEIDAVDALAQVTLSETFIPPVTATGASRRLVSIIEQIRGLLRSRATSLAAGAAGQGGDGRSGMLDIMTLGIANRFEATLAHSVRVGLHGPESIYREIIALAAELAAYAAPSRLPPEFPAYQHLDLRATFDPLLAILRTMLSVIVERNAISIPVSERDFGIWIGPIEDRMTFVERRFVLIARANVALEIVRQQLPIQIKIGPVEQIRDLVNLQLPGIAIQPLSVAPREIPFIQNAVYFEVDTRNQLWTRFRESAAIALHISGDYPGLALELWAIQRETGS
ncbi:type VI secretion system baseplate subunit TssK [Ciceribacter sp. L1K22]|uniref:type VI secretion system baseplate subunit TssK n=1 Tax=Ciceribacter sp. L1K22 TaxID=2820275 RepID=UPI001ABE1BBF|nr:type VI secretion system baseplate subunit TssK [Ciceribacter sp. L1K22]MBO3761680.1 type VI secretion system baseplate subunit TssK [Ciceribacter sp. L1K22]